MENINSISIIFQFIGIFLGYICSLDKDKKRILMWSVICGIISIINFAITNRIDGMASTIIICLRNWLFIYKDKYKTSMILWFCVAAHLIAGILSYKDIFSIVTIFIPAIIAINFWYGTVLEIKYTSIIVNTIWIFYYIHIGMTITAINTFVNICLSIIPIAIIYTEKKLGHTVFKKQQLN